MRTSFYNKNQRISREIPEEARLKLKQLISESPEPSQVHRPTKILQAASQKSEQKVLDHNESRLLSRFDQLSQPTKSSLLKRDISAPLNRKIVTSTLLNRDSTLTPRSSVSSFNTSKLSISSKSSNLGFGRNAIRKDPIPVQKFGGKQKDPSVETKSKLMRVVQSLKRSQIKNILPQIEWNQLKTTNQVNLKIQEFVSFLAKDIPKYDTDLLYAEKLSQQILNLEKIYIETDEQLKQKLDRFISTALTFEEKAKPFIQEKQQQEQLVSQINKQLDQITNANRDKQTNINEIQERQEMMKKQINDLRKHKETQFSELVHLNQQKTTQTEELEQLVSIKQYKEKQILKNSRKCIHLKLETKLREQNFFNINVVKNLFENKLEKMEIESAEEFLQIDEENESSFFQNENGVMEDVVNYDYYSKTTVISFLNKNKSNPEQFLNTSQGLVQRILKILKNDQISNIGVQTFNLQDDSIVNNVIKNPEYLLTNKPFSQLQILSFEVFTEKFYLAKPFQYILILNAFDTPEDYVKEVVSILNTVNNLKQEDDKQNKRALSNPRPSVRNSDNVNGAGSIRIPLGRVKDSQTTFGSSSGSCIIEEDPESYYNNLREPKQKSGERVIEQLKKIVFSNSSQKSRFINFIL